jgi:ABC-type proline/glycine betaine transport system ATPase subunit
VAQSSPSGDSDVVVEISDVWKIFGDNADAALAAIKSEGLGKAEVLAATTPWWGWPTSA